MSDRKKENLNIDANKVLNGARKATKDARTEAEKERARVLRRYFPVGDFNPRVGSRPCPASAIPLHKTTIVV